MLKAAYYDQNPVVILEHKGLYWSKVKGTDASRVNEPSEDYILPFGKANIVQEIWEQETDETITAVSYTHLDVYKRQKLDSKIYRKCFVFASVYVC